MKRLSFILIFFLSTLQVSLGQDKKSLSEKFLYFLNEYQKDSLNNLLSEDFRLTRTYTHFHNDKTTFLESYLPNSKAYNGKYKNIETIDTTGQVRFLVEDQSDYFKYLNIENPRWLFSIFFKDDKIGKVEIDTTRSYSKFTTAIRQANSEFDNWLKQNYPEVNFETLLKTEGLLLKLLRQYNPEKVRP